MTAICTVEGCWQKSKARGLYKLHHRRMRRSGELELLPILSPAQRFAAGLVLMPSGCLEWTGSPKADGYGVIRVDGNQPLTHRLAWELANGPIPEGMCICHHCDNPPCCQTEPTEGYPDGHLFLGTKAENNADRDAKGRNHNQQKTHCLRGHPFDEANTIIEPGAGRHCRTCQRAARARYNAKRQAS